MLLPHRDGIQMKRLVEMKADRRKYPQHVKENERQQTQMAWHNLRRMICTWVQCLIDQMGCLKIWSWKPTKRG